MGKNAADKKGKIDINSIKITELNKNPALSEDRAGSIRRSDIVYLASACFLPISCMEER